MGDSVKPENKKALEYRPSFKDAQFENLVFSFPCWAEPKFDGEFVVIFSDGKEIKIANSHKSVYTPTDNEHAGLPSGLYVLIAERISLRGDLYCYLTDRSIPNCPTLGLRVHGLVSFGGQDCTHLTYHERWKLLKEFFWNQNPNSVVQLVDRRYVCSVPEAKSYFDEQRAQGREGIVLKSQGTLFEEGIKLKPHITLDVAIIGIKVSKKWREKRIPNSFLLGINENGIWKPFGVSSSGLTDSEREKIGQEVLKNKTRENSKFIYCNPTVIIEIMFQEKKEKGFRHPRIVRIRDDKTINQATPSDQVKQQLKQEPKHKKKMTLASWDMKQTAVQRFLSDYGE